MAWRMENKQIRSLNKSDRTEIDLLLVYFCDTSKQLVPFLTSRPWFFIDFHYLSEI